MQETGGFGDHRGGTNTERTWCRGNDTKFLVLLTSLAKDLRGIMGEVFLLDAGKNSRGTDTGFFRNFGTPQDASSRFVMKEKWFA
ncbi:hypothetical protein TNCV_2658011 [Trichonephila clavipes]|nr:hypothetical protein TNCV_2658011 [Trichonephila clavipes]